jgi:hypothetical protein
MGRPFDVMGARLLLMKHRALNALTQMPVVQSFTAMPAGLKWLTLLSMLAVPLTLVTTVFGRVFVDGHEVPRLQWWVSGAGAVSLVGAFLVLGAAILVLRRSRYGRPALVLCWISAELLELAAPKCLGLGPSSPSSLKAPGRVVRLGVQVVIPIGILIYLYGNRAVRSYFLVVGGARAGRSPPIDR